MNTIELEIVTPNETVAKESGVTEIVIPASNGEVDILPDHTEFMTTLNQGEVRFSIGSSTKNYNVTGGLFSINDNKATILADSLLATVTKLDDVRREKK